MRLHWRIQIPTIIWGPLLSLLLNAILLTWISQSRPEYLRDYQLNQNPDAPHYVLLGRNLLLLGKYSRSSEVPDASDVFRTPAYPLFAGALDLIGGAALIYLFQALLQSFNCILVFILTDKFFGQKAALIASLLCATDLMLAVLNFEAMSETLYVFMISVSTLVLFPRIMAKEGSHPASFLLGGLLLGVATHVRPAGLYLPLVYAMITLAVGLFRGYWKKTLINSTMVILGAVILLAPWIVRNQVIFEIPRLTTNDTIVLVYFTGAGAYQVHHKVDLQTAQRMIAEEFGLQPPEEMWNHWKSDFSPKEMDDLARDAAPAVLSKYPIDLVKSSIMGIMKASISHNTGELADILGKRWINPGLSRLRSFDSSVISSLFENHIGLIIVCFWEVLHAVCVISLAYLGLMWMIYTHEQRLIGLIFGLLWLFFVIILGISGLEAYSRFRAPLMPLAYVISGYFLSMIYSRCRTRL